MIRPHEQTSYSTRFDGSAITAEETEFLLAMLAYQKRFCRRYPTWREVLLPDEAKSEIRRPVSNAEPAENSSVPSA
jgi:hypothetical protein